jgi:hypothetical protein
VHGCWTVQSWPNWGVPGASHLLLVFFPRDSYNSYNSHNNASLLQASNQVVVWDHILQRHDSKIFQLEDIAQEYALSDVDKMLGWVSDVHSFSSHLFDKLNESFSVCSTIFLPFFFLQTTQGRRRL